MMLHKRNIYIREIYSHNYEEENGNGPNTVHVRGARIERFRHVFPSELRESTRFDAYRLHSSVDAWCIYRCDSVSNALVDIMSLVRTSNAVKHIICECRATMWCCDGSQ